MFKIAQGQDTFELKNIYEAIDASGNAARCSFRIILIKPTTNDGNTNHAEYHDKLKQSEVINDESNSNGNMDIPVMHEQPKEWTEEARRLAEEKENRRERRRNRRRRRRKKGVHSKIHESQQQQNSDEIEDGLRGFYSYFNKLTKKKISHTHKF